MSAARLREAAALLRSRTEAASATENWAVGDPRIGESDKAIRVTYMSRVTAVGHLGTKANADYVAVMLPSVALALADWLEDFANVNLRWSERPGAGPIEPTLPALAVAEAILDGTS